MRKRRSAIIALVGMVALAAFSAGGRAVGLYLVALCVITYLLTKIVFDLSARRTQRRARLLGIGGAAMVLTGGLLWSVSYLLFSSETRAWLGSDIWYILLILAAFSVIACCAWLEFYRALKSKVSSDDHA